MTATVTEHFLTWNYAEGRAARIRYVALNGGTPSAEREDLQNAEREDLRNAEREDLRNAERGATPMLFIHGYGGMLEHWDKNMERVARSRPVYAMDLLGFGGSEKPAAPYSLELWSQQILFLLGSLGIRKIILAGHSLGGASCLWMAHHQPKHVEKLVLVDPAGIFPSEPSAIERFLFGAVGSPVVGDVLFKLFANSFGAKQSLVPTYHNAELVTDELVEQFARPLRDAGAINAYLAPSRNPDRFLLKVLPRPCAFAGKCMVVWGEFDRAFPPPMLGPKFMELLPGAQTYVIAGSAHCPHHESPEEFNRLLENFLSV